MKSSHYSDLNEFYIKHSAKTQKGVSYTHTRIPDKNLNIFGGSFIIPVDDEDVFYNLYYKSIFVEKKKEYLTEKQLDKECPIAIDFDFRYKSQVDSRLHTAEHIQDMIILYLEELKNFFVFNGSKSFEVYIFEKPNVNKLPDNSLTKDGIHMIIGLQMDHTMQMMLRRKIIDKLPEIWDLPLINDWESVLDEGISKGTTNWQLYGSRKPGHESYALSQWYTIQFDETDHEFMMNENLVKEFNFEKDLYKLSVRNNKLPVFDNNPKILEEYNRLVNLGGKKTKKIQSKTKLHLIVDDSDEVIMSLSDISDQNSLDKYVSNVLSSFKPNEYEIRETHEYTQVLPEKFYEPGSHLLNRMVAFALKKTDERLFCSWILLRSKASDFDFKTIPALYEEWKHFSKTNQNNECVTRKSILYWAKQYNFKEYERVKKETIDFAIEEALSSQTEYDKAVVLKQMFKDKYTCVSYDKKGVWYKFVGHRWVCDKGLSLREAISKQMYDLFSQKQELLENEFTHYDDPSDERRLFIQKKITILVTVKTSLKKTNEKNNIMREAMELFYDGDFIKTMDTKKHLLCFNNGVVDFKNKIFRDGYPDDYITKTTKNNFIEFDTIKENTKNEILDFMDTLFPIPELNKYMWDHLSASLIGYNKNQTFNVYHGSGSNGKSILADLMAYSLGDYKGTVPITLVTEKRGLIGGTSDEVLKLKGIRYAVMQEPSKNVKLNEGIMKELTGGDPIQARGLYAESEIFEPQFSLVVCTNNLFDIESNDDGTWRRIRKCDFVSKFVDEGEQHTDSTEFIFTKDKNLKDKLPLFAPTFVSMLVQRAFATDGIVEDCDYVMSASNKYRKGQDHIAAFLHEFIRKTDDHNDVVKKSDVYRDFKLWFQQEQGNRKVPKGQELYDYMDKKLGQHTSKGWHGYTIISSGDEENNQTHDDE
jgi:P4 family phage/plasmid primase-like protien